jgi:hypothetical protein
VRGDEGGVDFQKTGIESIAEEMKSEPVPTKVNKHAMCNKSPRSQSELQSEARVEKGAAPLVKVGQATPHHNEYKGKQVQK